MWLLVPQFSKYRRFPAVPDLGVRLYAEYTIKV